MQYGPVNRGFRYITNGIFNEGAILASDEIVLNDAGQTVCDLDSGSLDSNYTFYQVPVGVNSN